MRVNGARQRRSRGRTSFPRSDERIDIDGPVSRCERPQIDTRLPSMNTEGVNAADERELGPLYSDSCGA
jgi:hypothetical protein